MEEPETPASPQIKPGLKEPLFSTLARRLIYTIKKRREWEEHNRNRRFRWTFSQLAKDAGVPLSTINSLVQGKRGPSIAMVDRLLYAMGMSATELLYDREITALAYDLCQRYTYSTRKLQNKRKRRVSPNAVPDIEVRRMVREMLDNGELPDGDRVGRMKFNRPQIQKVVDTSGI